MTLGQEEWDEDEEEFGEAMEDCGLDSEGFCSQAGTEYCDFECPFRDSEDFRGSDAWLRKHGGNDTGRQDQ